MSGSRDDGVIIDFLKDSRNDELRLMLTILVIDGNNAWRWSFNRVVGMGSKEHDFDGEYAIISSMTRVGAGWNFDNVDVGKLLSVSRGWRKPCWWRSQQTVRPGIGQS